MPKVSLIQNAFNGGELSPLMKGRDDIDKYRASCETMDNFLPLLQGPAQKRAGTRFVREVQTSADAARIIPFEFNADQAYILEFGDTYFRVFKDGAVVLSGGSPYEVVTPYADDELVDLDFAQSADVMYITHPDYSVRKISRLADDSWTITEVSFDSPAFADENETATTMTASAVTGSITLTASASYFVSTDVGAHMAFYETIESKHSVWTAGATISASAYYHYNGNLYQESGAGGTTGSRPPIHTTGSESDGTLTWNYIHSGFGYAEITAYTSATVVDATVTSRIPGSATSAGLRWAISAWSDTRGHPRSVSFYEDRLWFGGCANQPQTLWASQSGDYENFEAGTIDSDSLNYTINSQKINPIQWMIPSKVLIVGTTGGEFVVSATNRGEAVTPTNVKITRQTAYGTPENVRPFLIGETVVFVQRSKRVVRQMNYSYDSEGYVAPSISEIAEHLLLNGIIDMTYEQQPYRVLWFASATGELIGLTYEPEQQVLAWHSHDVGGTVESLATIPHWDGDRDVTFMVVKRTINSVVVRYIEYLEKYLTDDYAFFLDSGLTYDSTPATSISGLDHLEGEVVSVLADGYVHPDRTVASGAITLAAAASIVNVGLKITSTLKTMPLSGGAADGTSQGKTARITNLVARLYQTGAGFKYGISTTDLDEFYTRDSTDEMDNPIALYSGDTDILPMRGGNEQSPSVVIQHSTPLPCTLLALMPQLYVEDR